MAFTTFAGPLRTGTVKEGSGRNTGGVVLAQSATIDMNGVALTTGGAAQNLFTLPAGSKILSFQVEKTVVMAGNSISACAMIIGNATDDNQYVESVAIAIAKGRTAQATVDAGMQVDDCDNIGTSDVLLKAIFTATTGNATSGQVVITVTYVQRDAAGNANPLTV